MSNEENQLGVIVVDHGSRRSEANKLLITVVDDLRAATGWPIVEPAHMELAQPSIADAWARCVAQGAKRIIVHPYFLGPGRHWSEDIPSLAAEAAAQHGETPFEVTRPLGPHPLLLQVIAERVNESV